LRVVALGGSNKSVNSGSLMDREDDEESRGKTGKGGAIMGTTLMKSPHSFVEPTRHHGSVMARVGAHQDRHLRHKARRETQSGKSTEDRLTEVAIRSATVTAGGLLVGLAQGHFGTSKIAGRVPGELLVGVVLHGIAFTEMAEGWSLRPVLRALGDGMFAAAAATGGYGLAAKRADPHGSQQAAAPQPGGPLPQPKGPAVRGYPEPESGGAALSDLELARFANRR
jgi:hypothetical protein